jgi:hypothetical protein
MITLNKKIMAKEKITIEISENDLKEILAKVFNLQLHNLKLKVHHYECNQIEPEYTKIVIESERNIYKP